VSLRQRLFSTRWFHRPFVSRPRILLPLAIAATIGVPGCATGAPASTTPVVLAGASNGLEQIPAGFTEHKMNVGRLGINYVIGGHGPTVVLLHGYPETWYMWRHVMPVLAEHYTVIAPDLPGAGKSDAPATGYDKKTMAANIHRLMVRLGRNHDIRLVGHDIGTMVAYAYAAANPRDVTTLVLSEAPIPDPSIYQFPALTPNGPGVWNFGFFSLTNGLPEAVVRGRETIWTDRFIDQFEFVKGAVTPDEVHVFAHYLQDRPHLEASFDWFRTFPRDIKDDAADQRTKLTMPVLAIGAQHSLGGFVPQQARNYATNVTGMVIQESGHWIYEEHPAEMTRILLDFLRTS
jgi:pimeloyl-ACP methyl ester carboxylesterase